MPFLVPCVPKILALFLFFLASGILGGYETFGQKAVVPDIKAGVSGVLTCTNTSVKLKGDSKTLGAYYAWTGPNGYYSTAQSPVTAIPGDYTLTVKDPVNGGTATAIVKVLIDTIAPAGIKATVSGLLTCKDTLVTLTVSSTTPGVSYDWKGPRSYVSATRTSVTANPGIYLVKVINPANGCTAKANVMVEQDIAPPSGVSATVSGILTCKVTSVTLTGTSGTKDARYDWSGQGLSSSVNKCEVSKPGTYGLLVTNPANGCSSKEHITVEQDVSVPAEVTAVALDTITCRNTKVTLKASSVTKEAKFNWSGPNSFISEEQTLKTSMIGQFTLTVTNPENGCFIKRQVMVVKDTTPPADVNVTASGTLTCITGTVTLRVSSSSPKVSYAWNGPASFTSRKSDPSVSLPGKYEVIATNSANGCSIVKTLKVDQNIMVPEGVSASVSGTLSCKTPRVILDGSCALKQVTYSWSGPQGFKSNEKSPGTKIPGNYSLTTTNQQNGCTSKVNVTVTGVACSESN